jgi:hypothetical protein
MWWIHCAECDFCRFFDSWVVFVTVSVLYGATEVPAATAAQSPFAASRGTKPR